MHDSRNMEVRSQEVARYLRDEAQRSPYRALAVALAAGYVLGGGLTPRLVKALMLMGGRALAGNLVSAAVRGTLDQRRIG